MNIGLLILIVIGGSAGVLSTVYIAVSLFGLSLIHISEPTRLL